MPSRTSTDYAALLLRISLGVMYLAHSVVLKLLTFGLGGTASFFEKVGLPRWLAYVTFAAEVVGGVLLILGIKARWVALGLTPALAGAIIFVHSANGWVFDAPNGGWEYPAFLLSMSVVQYLIGDGAFALAPSAKSADSLTSPS